MWDRLRTCNPLLQMICALVSTLKFHNNLDLQSMQAQSSYTWLAKWIQALQATLISTRTHVYVAKSQLDSSG